MTIWDDAPDNRSPVFSSETAHGDVVDIISDRGSISGLHQRLRRAAPELGNGLRPIPRHRLQFAAGPLFNEADDFQHFAHARLGLGSVDARRLIKRLAR